MYTPPKRFPFNPNRSNRSYSPARPHTPQLDGQRPIEISSSDSPFIQECKSILQNHSLFKNWQTVNSMYSKLPKKPNCNRWMQIYEFWYSSFSLLGHSSPKFASSFTLSNLDVIFTTSLGIRPVEFERTIAVLIENGVISTRQTFLESLYPSWTEWAASISETILGPFTPIYSHINSIPLQAPDDYCLPQCLTDIAHSFHKKLIEDSIILVDSLFSHREWESICTGDPILILEILRSEGKIFATKEGIKIGTEALTEPEIGIIKLKESIHIISHNLNSLKNRVEDLKTAAKELYQSGFQKLAVSKLRLVKLLNATIVDRVQNLENLERLLQSIQTAANNARISEAYKGGLQALSDFNKQTDIDELASIVDQIKDESEEASVNSSLIQEMSTELGLDSTIPPEEYQALARELQQLELEVENDNPSENPTNTNSKLGLPVEKKIPLPFPVTEDHGEHSDIGDIHQPTSTSQSTDENVPLLLSIPTPPTFSHKDSTKHTDSEAMVG